MKMCPVVNELVTQINEGIVAETEKNPQRAAEIYDTASPAKYEIIKAIFLTPIAQRLSRHLAESYPDSQILNQRMYIAFEGMIRPQTPKPFELNDALGSTISRAVSLHDEVRNQFHHRFS